MNIAIFSDTFFPQINGVCFSIKNLSLELVKRGHKIIVFAPSPGNIDSKQTIEGIPTVYFSSFSLPSYKEYKIVLFAFEKAMKKAKEFQPDIVYCETPFMMGRLGKRIAKELNVPCVGTYHTLIPDFLMYLPLPIIKKLSITKKIAWHITNNFYEKCAIVSTPSEAMKNELKKNGLRADIRAISNGIDLALFKQTKEGIEEFLKKNNIPKNAVKTVFFGRISFEKNIDILIKALKILNGRKEKRFVLLLVGNGPAAESLKKLAESLGQQENVFFTGALRDKALVSAVNAADFSVTASTIETQGLSILEGMACGLPAVAADYLAIPEAVKDNYNGFLFRAFDENDCAEKILRLAELEPKEMERFRENAKKTAAQHSMQSVAEQWEKVFAEAIEKTKKQAETPRV